MLFDSIIDILTAMTSRAIIRMIMSQPYGGNTNAQSQCKKIR